MYYKHCYQEGELTQMAILWVLKEDHVLHRVDEGHWVNHCHHSNFVEIHRYYSKSDRRFSYLLLENWQYHFKFRTFMG
jgi:hypothetical protein